MRLRSSSLSILGALLALGLTAFACATPDLTGDGDDAELPLPERVSSMPKTDASTPDSAPVVPDPVDAQADQEASTADANRLLHAFVSSAVINANLGGLAGADQKCNTLATAQGLKGTYRAWISVAGTNAADRITSNGPWHLVTGPLVAATKAELTSGKLKTPLDIDEKGVKSPAAEDRVWTGTAPNGTFSGPECDVWSGAGGGRVGEAGFSDGRWTSSTVEACSEINRVYCFEL